MAISLKIYLLASSGMVLKTFLVHRLPSNSILVYVTAISPVARMTDDQGEPMLLKLKVGLDEVEFIAVVLCLPLV